MYNTERILCNVFLLCLLCAFDSNQLTCPAKLEANFHQKNCTDRATNDTAYYLDRSTCIPKCKVYPTVVTIQDCTADPKVCVAGYSCEKRCGKKPSLTVYSCETDDDCTKLPAGGRAICSNYCVLPEVDEDDENVNCMAYHSNLPAFESRWWTAQKFKPVCDDDGKWEAKQCKGGIQGRCMCYSATGIRLFGQALYANSKDMTCACSRRKADLESTGRSLVSLHCDSMGNYEPLQCDLEKELCWCAEPKTGELTSPVVPEKAKEKLPCYKKYGSQYLRQCESKLFAQNMLTLKLKAHGVQIVNSEFLLCDADGSYGAYKVNSGIAYCTWRDNTLIEAWQSNLAELKERLTCNCARDFKLYRHTLSCDGSGNYLALQTSATGSAKPYCVDPDGFAKTGPLDDAKPNCTLYW